MDAIVGLGPLRRTEGATVEFAWSGLWGETTAVGLWSIPADRTVDVDGRMTSVGDGVLVDGRAAATLDTQCARCLSVVAYPATAEFEELFVYPEHAGDYADEDVCFIADDQVDLGPVIHDCLILAQPAIVLCQPDCRGLCPLCGVNLNEQPDHRHDAGPDERWQALAALRLD